MASKLLLAGAATVCLLASRILLRNWRATKSECYAELPGDEFVPDPAVMRTRAVSVHARASAVWPWLVQMGQNRGGLYSYTGLENLFGLRIHNADTIHPEWQRLGVGDEVWLVRRNWLGIADGLALMVVRIEPGRSIALLEKPWQAIWSFHLHEQGPDRCRLVSRSRAPRRSGLARLADELFDPITLLMTRKMLLGIKARAERPAVVHQLRGTSASPAIGR